MNPWLRLSVVTLLLEASNVSAATLYVWVDSPNPSGSYNNWATAAHTIQDAVNQAPPNGVVLVTNGVYPGGVTVNKGLLQLRGVNGPEFTVINSTGGRCVTVTNASGASLTGFTLANGSAWDGNGGGICSYSTNFCLTNCTLIGNLAWGPPSWDAGGGGGAAGCTLYNCTLVSNVVARGFWNAGGGGGAFNSTLYNCALSRNSISQRYYGRGGGAYGCVLYNCTLTDNEVAGEFGGGAYACTLVNCTLSGNAAGFTASLPGTSGAAHGCTLYNCTLTDNATNGSCEAYDCTLYNSIVYSERYYASSLSYCCTMGLPAAGPGNITNAPLFVDHASGNLRLQPNSPCINAGNNAYVSGTTDLDGNPRIVGGTVDIGAYECQAPALLDYYVWLQGYGLPTQASQAYADSDYDGMNNWQEWVCGTCPTNRLSALCLLSAAPQGANVAVSWQSVAGVNYFLERSANLTSPFTFVATNIIGQTGTTTYTDTNAAGGGPFFYRLGISGP